MEYKYNKILRFFEDYVSAYNQYGQHEDTIMVMDTYYTSDLSFPYDGFKGRSVWYKRCLNHPDVQDNLRIEHVIIDDTKNEISAILKTEAIDRATGTKLMELRMSALYTLRIDSSDDIKITTVKLFLESDPEKVGKLAQLYRIGM